MQSNDERISLEITPDQLLKGVIIAPGANKKYKLIFPVLKLRLNIDPNIRDSQDDVYTLYSNDANHYYKKSLTVKDDKQPDDNLLDLHYVGINRNLQYTLEADLGKNAGKFTIFKNTELGSNRQ